MNINYLHALTAYYFYILLGFRFVRWDKNKIMNTEFKGTQGRWESSPVSNFSDTLVCFVEAKDKNVAQLRGCTTGEEEEALANGQLIAAAPDLLKAAQNYLATCPMIIESQEKAAMELLNAVNRALGNEA